MTTVPILQLFLLVLSVLSVVGLQRPRYRPGFVAGRSGTKSSRLMQRSFALRMGRRGGSDDDDDDDDDSVLEDYDGLARPEGGFDSLEEAMTHPSNSFENLFGIPMDTEITGEELKKLPFLDDSAWYMPEYGFDTGFFETRLTGNKYDPYSQSVKIALDVCKTDHFHYKEVDVYASDLPEWFPEWHPEPDPINSTVPVTEFYGGAVMCTSSEVTLNLITDGYVFEGPRVLAPETYGEVDSELEWRFFTNTTLLPVAKAAVLGDESKKKEMIQLLNDVDDKVRGIFLVCDRITTADCSAFPFLWRIEQKFGCLPPNLKNWLDEMLVQEEVYNSVKACGDKWRWWWEQEDLLVRNNITYAELASVASSNSTNGLTSLTP
mmetsp:Transcript_15005/g.21988  ORF Transcript_15005/g.21988 Transcript_15005/m.21988 type:complete len:377 (+) Transcript_15005:70-1200(+)